MLIYAWDERQQREAKKKPDFLLMMRVNTRRDYVHMDEKPF